MLVLRLTAGLEYEFSGGILDLPGAPAAEQNITLDAVTQAQVIPLWFKKLPAGYTGSFQVRVRPPTSTFGLGDGVGVSYELYPPDPDSTFTWTGDFADGIPSNYGLLWGAFGAYVRAYPPGSPPPSLAAIEARAAAPANNGPNNNWNPRDQPPLIQDESIDDLIAEYDRGTASTRTTGPRSSRARRRPSANTPGSRAGSSSPTPARARATPTRSASSAASRRCTRSGRMGRSRSRSGTTDAGGRLAAAAVEMAVQEAEPVDREAQEAPAGRAAMAVLAAPAAPRGPTAGRARAAPAARAAARSTRTKRSARAACSPASSRSSPRATRCATRSTSRTPTRRHSLPRRSSWWTRSTRPSSTRPRSASARSRSAAASSCRRRACRRSRPRSTSRRPSRHLCSSTRASTPRRAAPCGRSPTLDPQTRDLPEDGLVGFLPPNRTSPEGEGSVGYTVEARPALPTGTALANRAEIVFDVNAPIVTPLWTNVTDDVPPTTTVRPLATGSASPLTISVDGSDAGVGIEAYGLYVSTDGGPFGLAQISTDPTFTFEGEIGRSYAFFSVGTDYVLNVEGPKNAAEASTTVVVAGEDRPDVPAVLTLDAGRPKPRSRRDGAALGPAGRGHSGRACVRPAGPRGRAPRRRHGAARGLARSAPSTRHGWRPACTLSGSHPAQKRKRGALVVVRLARSEDGDRGGTSGRTQRPTAPPAGADKGRYRLHSPINVIPVKAGIHARNGSALVRPMDSRLRGNDGVERAVVGRGAR